MDSKPTILVAEDHPESRDALCLLLQAFGYAVRSAQSGAEAVASALAQPPDLILMDVMMPGMDGLTAARRLRQDAAFPRVPIIAVTALDSVRNAVLDAGCDDYLTKPIDTVRMLAVLRRHLGRQPGLDAVLPPVG